MRRYTLTITALALVCAGPIALLGLFGGQAIAFLVCALFAVAVVMAAVLDRHGHRVGADAIVLAGLSAAALILGSVATGPVNAGTMLALASALYGFVVLKTANRGWALSFLFLAFAGFFFEPAAIPSAGQTALSVIAALAALAMSVVAIAVQARPETAHASEPEPFAAIEDMIGAIVHYDQAGKPVHISPVGARLFHCRPYELSNGGLFERVHVLDRPAYAKALSDIGKKGGAATLEVRLRDDGVHDGTVRYKWLELSLSQADQRQSIGTIGIFRDISARKAIEDDLRQSRAAAEEASDAKTRFLATIGHELRTPLNAIVGFSDMMAEGIGGNLSPTHHEYTGHIRQSGHHLLDVVNMLLDMSKIDAGKFELQAEPFDPLGLVGPCIQMVEALGRDRKIAVNSNLPDQLPQLVGDERSCRQIVINLLSNAIKFSHDGGRVTLAMRRQGKMLAISVMDNGIGMSSDTVKRIGEPFLQAQNGLARRYEGTGLGLSIVKGLVSLHNGRMTVASEPDVGTRVTVFLPLDGPSQNQPAATIQHLHSHRRDTDEQKWQEDERRSATS